MLLVEGHGDVAAVPVLVKRLFTESGSWQSVGLDPHVIRAGEIRKLLSTPRDRQETEWERFLRVAAQRPGTGGVLLLVDGDADKVAGQKFCAAIVAQRLSALAKNAGGGTRFSVASVFACQEFESWLIAGIGSVAGKRLPDGRAGVRPGVANSDINQGLAKRGAKEWLGERMESGYKETLDQAPLTQIVSLDAIRERNLRSFRRFENALRQLVIAISSGSHIVSP
ncbi:MAG: DUF4276 family protein [Planctomycetota bacterium]